MDHRPYVNALLRWLEHARAYIYPIPGQPGLACYGPGYDTWGVQTNQKAFSALGVLAADPDADFAAAKTTREAVLSDALSLLRFSLQSHVEGELTCTDGAKWGHTWISALGVERMMHAVDALKDHLTAADRELLRRMIISEADWLLREYPIVAGIVENNKPESNIWNGALLHRAALMYPDAPNCAAYRQKGTAFLLNGNSRPQDAQDDTLFDGKPLKAWHVGPNYTQTFGLNHHGYLNVGYMVISLSDLALLHFAFKTRGKTPPAALQHNFAGLWEVVRACQFEDGRLLRIGGDTRARYCYCQDYLLPVWLMVEDVLGESCAAFEEAWMAQVEREMAVNNDGSFLSHRCRALMVDSPLYYTRLEADRATAFSFNAYCRRVCNTAPHKPATALLPSWHCEFHGSRLTRGKNRIASFTWRASELPAGLCLPAERSDMAEWRYNLSGRVEGTGTFTFDEVVRHEEHAFPGGFVTGGATAVTSELFMAEGQGTDNIGLRALAFAALPDDKTVLCIQRLVAAHRVYVRSVKGLLLHMPNDLWNGFSRRYETAAGDFVLRGMQAEEALRVGAYAVADGRLGVALPPGENLTLLRGKKRQITLKRYRHSGAPAQEGTLYCDEIVTGETLHRAWFSAGEIMYDVGFAVAVDGAGGVAALSASLKRSSCGDIRLLRADASGSRYLLAFNAGETAASFAAEAPLLNLADGRSHGEGAYIPLAPLAAALYRVG